MFYKDINDCYQQFNTQLDLASSQPDILFQQKIQATIYFLFYAQKSPPLSGNCFKLYLKRAH